MQRTISQVIQRLEYLKTLHGDIPCYLQTSGGLDSDLSFQVESAEDWNHQPDIPNEPEKFVVVYGWEDEID